MKLRHDGRPVQQLRTVDIQTHVLKHALGSALISFGDTKVLCAASVENQVPAFLQEQNSGWITAEYSMLPQATNDRTKRESVRGRQSGRTLEIQRLIGRSLRACVDLNKLGARSLIVDCDVLQADGGTRTASITGGYVALRLAIERLLASGELKENPLQEYLAAVSVGILPEIGCVLDMDYTEDSQALVDMNLVMTESGEFVELQGTGEGRSFSGEELNKLLLYGKTGIIDLITCQKTALLATYPLAENQQVVQTNEIVIATRNPGKAKEFSALFGKQGYQVKTLLDYPELPDVAETGHTFEANARLKAETIASILKRPVLADDSGLLVDALDGMPGVYSARFAGEHKSSAANNAKLLYELTGVPDAERTAHFHCTLVLAAPGRDSLVVSADWNGQILRIPRGDNGFGYDPLFFVPEEGLSAAELDPQRKNQISHRAQAIAKLETRWQPWLEEEECE